MSEDDFPIGDPGPDDQPQPQGNGTGPDVPEESSFAIGVPGRELERPGHNRWAVGFLLVCAGLVLLAILLPNFKTHKQGSLTACKSNCRNLATALEMYATDNGGRYPVTFDKLVEGNYMKLIPTCPAAGRVTYDTNYQYSTRPDTFSFTCAGNNHAQAYSGFSTSSNNFPRYHSEQGLCDYPKTGL